MPPDAHAVPPTQHTAEQSAPAGNETRISLWVPWLSAVILLLFASMVVIAAGIMGIVLGSLSGAPALPWVISLFLLLTLIIIAMVARRPIAHFTYFFAATTRLLIEELVRMDDTPTTGAEDQNASDIFLLARLRRAQPLPPVEVLPPAQLTERPLIDDRDLAAHPHTRIFPADGPPGYYSLRQGWRLIAASRRGLGHASEGKYREDEFYIQSAGDAGVLLAIADGVGSRTLARHGATAAVTGAANMPASAIAHLADVLEATPLADLTPTAPIVQAAYGLLTEAFGRAQTAVMQRAAADSIADPAITIDDLQTTLIVAIVIPHHDHFLFIASGQIGDGALYAHLPTAEGMPLAAQWRTILVPQIGAANDEVMPLTQVDQAQWQATLQCEPALAAAFLMGMTDGTADDLRPPPPTEEQPDPDPYVYIDEFQHLIRQHIAGTDGSAATALLDFLAYRKKQSLDDRTVVCLYVEEEGS